jgi:hypothetical protein
MRDSIIRAIPRQRKHRLNVMRTKKCNENLFRLAFLHERMLVVLLTLREQEIRLDLERTKYAEYFQITRKCDVNAKGKLVAERERERNCERECEFERGCAKESEQQGRIIIVCVCQTKLCVISQQNAKICKNEKVTSNWLM